MPGVSGVTVVTNACAFYHCTRGCGRIGRPAFPVPSAFSRDDVPAQLGRFARRECEAASRRYCNDDVGLHSWLFEIRIRTHDRAVVGPPAESRGTRLACRVRLRYRFARATPDGVLRGRATRSPQGRSVVPLAGIEPALLAELDFQVERVYQFRHRGLRTPAFGPTSQSGRNIAGGDCRSTRESAGLRRSPGAFLRSAGNRRISTAFYRSSR